jgi:hypothetical protein
MKVRIITERDFPFEDLSRWIRHCISVGIPLDEAKLRNDGFCEFDCDNGYTKAHSRYEIIKTAPQNNKDEIANRSVAGSQDQCQQAKAAIALFTTDQSWIRIKYLGRVGLNGLLKWLEEKAQQQP